jgi:gluconate 2-dehydrogenase gamma chain
MYKNQANHLQISKKWNNSRRDFVKKILAVSVAGSLPFWLSCKQKQVQEFRLKDHQKKIAAVVQEFLFPADGNGPSSAEINAMAYFQWALWEKGTDLEDKKYLVNGIEWVNETSEETYKSPFLNLSEIEQNSLLTTIVAKDWGESWLSMMLSIILEALFCDPVYGGNPNRIGWLWLEHNPGQPRPTEEIKLENFKHFVQSKYH